MKKLSLTLIISALAVLFCFVLCSCGDKTEGDETESISATQSQQVTEAAAVSNADTTNGESKEVDVKAGTLVAVTDNDGKQKQNDFIINGLILIGNQHTYFGREEADAILDYFVKDGYKKEGINSSFYLNEWIEIYADTNYSGSEDDVMIFLLPHKSVEEYEKMSVDQLSELATENGGAAMQYQKPNEENAKFLAEAYVNGDYPEGAYDLLFTYKGSPAYYVTLDVIKES